MYRTTSVRFTEDQRRKLRKLSESLSKSPNAVMGMLVDNAELHPVERLEAVSRLSVKENGRSVETLTGLHTASVGA